MSLTYPHPIYRTCNTNPFEANKCISMAAMLSGRFKTDKLSRHWDKTNKEGYCKISPLGTNATGDLPHLILFCPALIDCRQRIISYWNSKTADNITLSNLTRAKLSSSPTVLLHFLLDPSIDQDVISLCQTKFCSLSVIFPGVTLLIDNENNYSKKLMLSKFFFKSLCKS